MIKVCSPIEGLCGLLATGNATFFYARGGAITHWA